MTSRIINKCVHPNEIRSFTITRPPTLPTVLAGSVLLQIGPELTDQVRIIQRKSTARRCPPLPCTLCVDAAFPISGVRGRM